MKLTSLRTYFSTSSRYYCDDHTATYEYTRCFQKQYLYSVSYIAIYFLISFVFYIFKLYSAVIPKLSHLSIFCSTCKFLLLRLKSQTQLQLQLIPYLSSSSGLMMAISLQPKYVALFLTNISLICDNRHNAKFVIFREKRLKVLKCYNFLRVQRRHNCSLAASFANCVTTLHLLKVHLQAFLSIPINKKCQILSCDTLVANERYAVLTD
jgi:hypothetical protein